MHNFLLEEEDLDCPWKNSLGVDLWLKPAFSNHSNEALRRHLGVEEVTEAHWSLDTTSLGVTPSNVHRETADPDAIPDSNSDSDLDPAEDEDC